MTQDHGRPAPGVHWVNTDGAIRAQPGQPSGEAAIGVVLWDPDGRRIDTLSERIGWAEDHHVAEYTALIRGLELAKDYGIQLLRAYVDSDLVVNTVAGSWDLKPDHLIPLRDRAKSHLGTFEDIRICWVPRELNIEADELAGAPLRGLR